jgi:hypothetical protein
MRTLARLLGDLLIVAIIIFIMINATASIFHHYHTDLFIGKNINQHYPIVEQPE